MGVSHLIPYPQKVVVQEGEPFELGSPIAVATSLSDALLTRVLPALGDVARDWDLPLGLVDEDGQAAVTLICDSEVGTPGPGRPEAYTLEITEAGITVTAGTASGFFHAFSALAQLADRKEDGSVLLPPVLIVDQPRFEWRGLSLDVGRSFFPPQEVKRVVDLLARYRFNRLHLHLSDDQGWRLQVKIRPKLTARSGKTAVEGGRAGFYTEEDLSYLTEYAASRGVTIVPEVDIPGHTNAATHAYGELVPEAEPTPAYSGMQVGFSRLHADLPATEAFLRDVFQAVADQTPGPYVHVGGDEAFQVEEHEYVELVNMAVKQVLKSEKTVVVWQEGAKADLPSGSILQYWDPRADLSGVVSAAKRGVRILMSPANRTYLDMKYSEQTPLGQDWAGLLELRASYEWDPNNEIALLPADSVIGVEAGIWTEKIHTFEDLTYMLLPRLGALAEVGWTEQAERNWDSFAKRIGKQASWWDQNGYAWHRSPGIAWPTK